MPKKVALGCVIPHQRRRGEFTPPKTMFMGHDSQSDFHVFYNGNEDMNRVDPNCLSKVSLFFTTTQPHTLFKAMFL